ncbi:MAG: gliding motility protein GldL [Lentimicrobiaceae bacterium]|nr:gliding motility protein GldL [Lentimicrobiaceae bacterium]
MGLQSIVTSKGYKLFMAKLYGIGAAVAITGALFKIVHLPGANIMLIAGLSAEAIIFFFSAFEPPYVEPDWSLVYPELAGMYEHMRPTKKEKKVKDKDKKQVTAPGVAKTPTQELDDMLTQAKIGPELIESLGEGMRRMSENVSKMSNVTDSAITSDTFVRNVTEASKSASELSKSYQNMGRVLDEDAKVTGEFSNSIKSAASTASNLAQTYEEVSGAIKKEINVAQTFSNTMSEAANSANNLVQKYNESAELLSKSADILNFSASDSKNYNEQLQKISNNLATLNNIYEMQVKSVTSQVDSSKELTNSVSNFLSTLETSAKNMDNYQKELSALTQRVAALNQVYGNMLSAMNFNPKN